MKMPGTPRYLIIAGELILLATLGIAVFLLLEPKALPTHHMVALIISWALAIVGMVLIMGGFLLVRPHVRVMQTEFAQPVPKPPEVRREIAFESLRIGSTTDVGRRRTLNEDSIAAIEIQFSFESKHRSRCMMIVGDGMGGHEKGEIASSMGVKTVVEMLQPVILDGEADLATGLQRAIEEANSRILEYSTAHPECQGMGTTLTAAVIDGRNLIIGHVGDSRAYLINDKEIVQITRDHSLVQEMVEKGEITAEQARTHPKRNVIIRVVGYYGRVEPEVFKWSLEEGDHVLVCCDGLVIHMTDDEIKQIVLQNPDPQQASARLVALANERGGQDNISVIIATARGIAA